MSPRKVLKIVHATEQMDGVGARVRRSIGRPSLKSLDPFLMLDHFHVEKPAGFPDHPHRGFETTTYILNGAIEHEDFMGNRGLIRQGDLQWMTAGRGVVHAEMPHGDQVAEGLQLWVNLPRAHKMMEPRYQEFLASQVPEAYFPGISARIIAGQALGVSSPVQTVTPVHYIHFSLEKAKSLVHPVPAAFNAFIYVIAGSGKVSDQLIKAGQCAVLSQDGENVHVTAETTMSFVFLAGQPIGEPVVQHGPFVLCDVNELQQTFEDFDEAKNGFERSRNWKSDIGNKI
jgi:redox-sensitive bicupin YhaK (pirin superfamily)